MTTEQQGASGAFQCKVCGDAARYSYFGAMACESCKMFFKRNAGSPQKTLKCHFNHHCEINLQTRHTCAHCRLQKCLAVGMRAELLRPSRLKKTEDHQRTTTSAIEVDEHQSDQKPSKTIEEQIIPSNFIRSLNESKIRDFLAAQDALPPKLRFRRGAVTNFFTLIIENLQCNLQSNAYFLSLPDHDRQILFRRTRRYPAILALILIFRHYHLFDNQCFYNSVEHIFGSQATFAIKCAIDQLDSDEIFIQIILTALIFSTISTTTESTYFTDLKSLLSIEEIYTDISWRYISYRYGYDDAVVRFSQLVRCLLTVNTIIMEAQTSPEYTQMINLILEHKLCL